jgi:hypothetical protein
MSKRTVTGLIATTAVVASAALAGGVISSTGSTSVADAAAGKQPTRVELLAARQQLLHLTRQNAAVQRNLKTFDTLDFDVFSNQKWERLGESHAKNIRVYWPDGHVTVGLARHTEDLKQLFVHAPDTRIKEHPIRFGSGNQTAVTGVFEGTFTRPMPDGKGGFIAPTGKAFKLPMATIGIWKNGVMVEEHLFWDNQTYARQIGLG